MLDVQLTSLLEAGTDEAGRGCLAGPVTASAVILPLKSNIPLLNDSKKLTEKQRYNLRPIIEKNAIAFGVAFVYQQKIDKINILNASILAMNKAILNLKTKPEFILVDGNRFTTKLKIPFKCIIKGDSKYMNIAAASILAKTSRDELMKIMSIQNINYKWDKNNGYPTKEHRKAILKFGVTKHHRKSFKLL